MKLKEIKLLSNNLAATEKFYNGVLEINTNTSSDTAITFLIGTTKLSFEYTTIPQPKYHVAIDIPNNKLNEAFTWLQTKTEILPVPAGGHISNFTDWNAQSFYFYDNNGNLMELIARMDVPNHSDTPFSAHDLLYISEIGMVTNDVAALADKLNRQYGTGFYSKQPKLDNFIALGNDEGLFILVDTERNWYPTTTKGKAFPLEVVFEVGGVGEKRLRG